MFWRRSKVTVTCNTQSHPLNPALSLVQESQPLLKQPDFDEAVRQLNDQINCTPEYFDELYSATFQRLVKITQRVPVSQNNLKPFFLKQMQQAIRSLKLTQGQLFPKDITIEERNAHEPRWSYAIFSAALLHGIEKIQHDRLIDYYDPHETLLGSWSPLLNDALTQTLYYHVRWELPKAAIASSVLITASVMQIIPSHAMHWLAEDASLFEQWWETLLDLHASNELAVLVRAGFSVVKNETLTEETLTTTVTPQTNHTQPSVDTTAENLSDAEEPASPQDKPTKTQNLVLSFTQWVISQLNQQPDLLNDLFYRVAEGFFVTREAIQAFVTHHHVTEATLINDLLKTHDLLLNSDHYFHVYCSRDYTERNALEGILLNESIFKQPLNHLSRNDTIEPDILQEGAHDRQ